MTTTNDSYVLKSDRNGIEVKTTLYGEVTPERIDAAKRELAHRLDQLQPIPKMTDADQIRQMRQEERERYAEDDDDFEHDDRDWR